MGPRREGGKDNHLERRDQREKKENWGLFEIAPGFRKERKANAHMTIYENSLKRLKDSDQGGKWFHTLYPEEGTQYHSTRSNGRDFWDGCHPIFAGLAGGELNE